MESSTDDSDYEPAIDETKDAATSKDSATQPSSITKNKRMLAVACEVWDLLIKEFGESNPILTELRSLIFPNLFIDPPQSMTVDHILREKKSQENGQSIPDNNNDSGNAADMASNGPMEGIKLEGKHYLNW
jgi:hypothetical protein